MVMTLRDYQNLVVLLFLREVHNQRNASWWVYVAGIRKVNLPSSVGRDNLQSREDIN